MQCLHLGGGKGRFSTDPSRAVYASYTLSERPIGLESHSVYSQPQLSNSAAKSRGMPENWVMWGAPKLCCYENMLLQLKSHLGEEDMSLWNLCCSHFHHLEKGDEWYSLQLGQKQCFFLQGWGEVTGELMVQSVLQFMSSVWSIGTCWVKALPLWLKQQWSMQRC